MGKVDCMRSRDVTQSRFFVIVVTATRLQLLTGVSIHRARVEHIEMDGNWTNRRWLPLPAILWNYRYGDYNRP